MRAEADRTEVLLLTSLAPYRSATPAHTVIESFAPFSKLSPQNKNPLSPNRQSASSKSMSQQMTSKKEMAQCREAERRRKRKWPPQTITANRASDQPSARLYKGALRGCHDEAHVRLPDFPPRLCEGRARVIRKKPRITRPSAAHREGPC